MLPGTVQGASFATIFAPELYSRLCWFVRLRWLAALGLAAAAVLGERLGFPDAWPGLLLIAGFISLYNLVFSASLRRRGSGDLRDLRGWALSQIVMDLVALLVTAVWTGGMESPALPFLAFHMAIGTMLVRNRSMVLIATGTCIAITCLSLAERTGMLLPGRVVFPAANAKLLALITLIFGVVYLTGSVTRRFKDRSIELQQTSETLRERSAELQRLLEVKGELERQKSHYMRISAHQLRSPLGTIKTSLQVLLDGYLDPASERGRRLLAGAAERVVDLLAIVNDLLELAKMREGRAKAPWTRQVSLNQVLTDILDTVEPFASQQQVGIKAEMTGVGVLRWGVPPDLVYAFENLVNNAIKYSLPGGQVTVQLKADGNRATVTVSDRGIGIPAELLDDVFLEFVRAPNAKRHADEGTGLGLSIVRQAIRGHGGDVSVTSTEGEGSTFTVDLPLDYIPEEVVASGQEVAGEQAEPAEQVAHDQARPNDATAAQPSPAARHRG